jgi:hypothetical protein
MVSLGSHLIKWRADVFGQYRWDSQATHVLPNTQLCGLLPREIGEAKSVSEVCRQERLAAMPVVLLLIGMRNTQHCRFVKWFAGDL